MSHPLRAFPVCLALLCACAPPSVEDVSRKAADELSAFSNEAWDSVAESTNASNGLADLVTAINLTLVDLGKTPLARPNIPARGNGPSTLDTYTQFLKDHVFTNANLESSGPNGLVFLLHGKDLCSSSTATTSSAQCEKTYDDLQLRVIASGDPDAQLTLDVAIGPNKLAPISIVLVKDHSAEVVFRLDVYRQLITTLVNQSASMLPFSQQLPTFEGEYRFRVEKLGKLDFAFSFGATRDVKMEYRGSDQALTSYAMAAQMPIYRVRFDGVNHTQDLGLNIGTITASFPVSALTNAQDSRVFALTAQGMSFDATNAASGALASGHFSLQPTRATFDGVEVLNVSNAQPLTMTLTTATDGRLKLTSTDVDATARFHFNLLPGWVGDAPVLGDENWQAKLGGPNAAIKLSSVPNTAPADATLALKLLSGAFTLEALNAHDALEVQAGSCAAERVGATGGGALASFITTSCQ